MTEPPGPTFARGARRPSEIDRVILHQPSANGKGTSENLTWLAATELRAAGFALCRPDPDEKKPTYKGWPTFSLEPPDFPLDALIAIIGGPLSHGDHLGHALIVIDLDAIEAIIAADEYLPETGMVEGRVGKPRSH